MRSEEEIKERIEMLRKMINKELEETLKILKESDDLTSVYSNILLIIRYKEVLKTLKWVLEND